MSKEKSYPPIRINEHVLTDKISTFVREGFDGWQAGFTIQQQTFYLQPASENDDPASRKRAEWFQTLLEHGLWKIIKNEYETLLP